MSSIFSKIASGEIPSIKLYEDERTLAFLDISPASRGHTLVICKEEFADLWSIPEETLVAVTRTVRRVAFGLRDALKPDGLNVIQNNGAASGQAVFHFHVHLIPRWEGDHALRLWKPQPADQDELRTVGEQIRQAIDASTLQQ